MDKIKIDSQHAFVFHQPMVLISTEVDGKKPK
jgi:hypothetical protein